MVTKFQSQNCCQKLLVPIKFWQFTPEFHYCTFVQRVGVLQLAQLLNNKFIIFTEFINFLSFFYSLNIFGKSNLTHLTTDVIFSGQSFAILAMFVMKPSLLQVVAQVNCLPSVKHQLPQGKGTHSRRAVDKSCA